MAIPELETDSDSFEAPNERADEDRKKKRAQHESLGEADGAVSGIREAAPRETTKTYGVRLE